MKKYYEPDVVAKLVPKEPIPEEVRVQYLRPGEILSIQEKFPVAYMPVDTLEWHGRQNPIGCDTIKAEQLCIEAAKITGGVVMPPVYFAADGFRDCGHGYAIGMDAYAGFQLPGSYYEIDLEIMKNWTINACNNYLNRGYRLVIIVSGHNPPLQSDIYSEVCYRMKSDEGREPVVFTMEYSVLDRDDLRYRTDHGAGYETSMMLHLTDRVNMQANLGLEPESLAIGGDVPYDEATAEEGRISFELQVEGMARFAREKYANLAAFDQ